MLIEKILLMKKVPLIESPENEVVLKLTVEERKDGVIISTYWEPGDSLENDRHVKEHETISGALCEMYRDAIAFMGARVLDDKYEIEVSK